MKKGVKRRERWNTVLILTPRQPLGAQIKRNLTAGGLYMSANTYIPMANNAPEPWNPLKSRKCTDSAKIGFVDQYQETQIVIVGSTGIVIRDSQLQTESEQTKQATHKS